MLHATRMALSLPNIQDTIQEINFRKIKELARRGGDDIIRHIVKGNVILNF